MARVESVNVHFQQLAYLREIARGGTWSEAAKRLHISQPALSQAMSELERRLEVPLFDTVGRRRVLSAEGEELLAFAERSLDDLSEVVERLRAGAAGEGGRLRVGMIDAASLYILPGAIREHRRKHRSVRLLLTVAASSELLERLHHHELDLAFITGPHDESGFDSETLLEEKLHIYGPKGARLESDVDWVLYPRGSHTRQFIDAALAERSILPRVVLESGNPQVLRQMVSLGFGWSVLPEGVVHGAARECVRHGRQAVASREIQAVYRSGRREEPRLAAFLQLARQRARRS